ncbi:HNH endonuclease [Mycoplasma marinum]|uniref:HNH endonuclease n=1 Tax=Mycoplasma marinum TaxID=1937190 RepID=A0A4R0XVT1_9MOLU|nr:hypothetical protein [Mycoplasma marinum]TCG11061.1 hypothetical protein C4B24_03185 [Mycoplasma marinum]
MKLTKEEKEWLLLPKALPIKSHFKNPRMWMGKENWDKVRKEVYKRAKYLCELCGGKGYKHPVEAHEMWIFNLKTLEQVLLRFVALCPSCHRIQHMGLAAIHTHEGKLNPIRLASHFNRLRNTQFSYSEINVISSDVFHKLNKHEFKIVLDKCNDPLFDIRMVENEI